MTSQTAKAWLGLTVSTHGVSVDPNGLIFPHTKKEHALWCIKNQALLYNRDVYKEHPYIRNRLQSPHPSDESFLKKLEIPYLR